MEPGLQPELFKIIYWTALNKNQLMCYYLAVLLTVILLTEPECYYHPIISMVRTNFFKLRLTVGSFKSLPLVFVAVSHCRVYDFGQAHGQGQ